MEVRDVCFVRHAKSSWDQPGTRDFDRTLDARGLRDAPMMARKMKEMGLIPDLIVTSGAKRAMKTAEFFQKEFDLPANQFMVADEIYESAAEEVFEVVRSLPDSARFVFVFGHNPTFTWIANSIAGVQIDNVPTCGIVHAQVMTDSWKKFKPEYAGFVGLHYPKQYTL